MNDLIEIGVYEGTNDERGATLHLQKQRISSGRQRATVTVAKQLGLVGIDPRAS